MEKYVSMQQPKTGVLMLQEKWSENIKRHPIAFGFLFLLLFVAPLVLVLFYTPKDRMASLAVPAAGCLFFFLINIPSIIRIFSPKRYEVSVADGRLKIIKNDKEVLNIKGSDITYLKFVKQFSDYNGLVVHYDDEKSNKGKFTMNMAFIPKSECEPFVERVAVFYSQNAVQSKQTDGQNWKQGFFIGLVCTIILGCILGSGVEDRRAFVGLVFSVLLTLFSLFKLLNNAK